MASSRKNRTDFDNISEQEMSRLVGEIHNKLDSVIFNGGFETLVQEVQNIERAQSKMLAKIEELHQVVYEPDDGLFARVKKVENFNMQELKPIQNEIQNITIWKNQLNTPKDGFIARTEANHLEVERIIQWKTKIIAVVLSALGASLLMVGKMIWEFISTHVTIR